jgi:hypothetical protein
MNSTDVHTEQLQAERDRVFLCELLLDGFQRAVARCGVVDHTLRIANSVVQLRFAGDALPPQILPALRHLHCDASLPPDLTLCLWDSTSTATRLPLLAESLVDLLRLRWWERLDIRREIKGYNDARIHALFHLGPDILSVLDVERSLGLYWIPDAAAVPYYERGYPLTALFSWQLDSRNCQLLHAAAVGYEWGGALLPGKGGSGKSSTTLACLDSNLRILGDDYCIVNRQPSPHIYSLFNTSKLKGAEDVARFARYEQMIDNPDRLDDEKALIFLHQHAPERLLTDCPAQAILLPRVTGRQDTTLQRASLAAALRYLAPSTMFQLPGNAERTFREAVALSRQLPVFEIGLGTDVRQIPRVIGQAIEMACQGRRND